MIRRTISKHSSIFTQYVSFILFVQTKAYSSVRTAIGIFLHDFVLLGPRRKQSKHSFLDA